MLTTLTSLTLRGSSSARFKILMMLAQISLKNKPGGLEVHHLGDFTPAHLRGKMDFGMM